jgi:nicotinate-nucleotide pyrophosphorylase (carboxylating)
MLPYAMIQTQVSQALAEDIGSGDITAALIPEEHQSSATLICRESAILCGQQWFNEVFEQLKTNNSSSVVNIDWQVNDGQTINKDQCICHLVGNTRNLLTGERTAMNFLQTLSGTATTTAHYVKQLKGSAIKLLDTRKTLPNFRAAQKYAGLVEALIIIGKDYLMAF